ncbi:ABC transporter permease [Faecalicatena contorta]|uniref:ABC transporter permease n=1 Tax=Faecalicatena contorta TaxID=39482 RepID=UPI003216A526
MNIKTAKCFRHSISWFIKENSALVIMLCLILVGTIAFPQFLTVKNIFNITGQSSFNALLAIGMTFVILTGGIDLSVGSIFAFAGVLASYLQVFSLPFIFLICLIGCTAMGFLNGIIITKLNIAPFIVTLATMMGYRGICYLLTDGGFTRNISNKGFNVISNSELFGIIPMSFIIMLIVLFIAMWGLKYTSFGRAVYAVGGNSEAAYMMGLRVQKIKILVYTISGFTAGLAGILMASRTSTGNPVVGEGYEMNAISAVVLGATLLSGGKGKVLNSVFGAIVLGTLNNLMNLQGNMSAQLQQVILGMLLLVIVIAQSRMNK